MVGIPDTGKEEFPFRALSVAEFLAFAHSDVSLPPRPQFIIDIHKSSADTLYLTRAGRTDWIEVPATNVKAVIPYDTRRPNAPGLLVAYIVRDQAVEEPSIHDYFQRAEAAVLSEDPHIDSVTIEQYPEPPGGVVKGVPAIVFQASTSAVVRYVAPTIWPSGSQRLDTQFVIFSLRVGAFGNFYLHFQTFYPKFPVGPGEPCDLGNSRNFGWCAACFQRAAGSSDPWTLTPVSSIRGWEFTFFLGIRPSDVPITSTATIMW